MTPGVLERPLGVRADAPLTARQLSALGILNGYDLGPVRERLLRTAGLTPSLVDLMIFEFRRYLGLRLIHDRSVPMLSCAVDEVWHTALLFTRLYADLCERVFGAFVHHDPATEAWTDLDERWNDFSASYRGLYGPLGILWDNARRSAMGEGPPVGARPTDRRAFLRGIIAAPGALLLSGHAVPQARAATTGMPRVGYPTLVPVTAPQGGEFLEALRQGLAELGYTEGKNVTIELRDAGGSVERLPRIIEELVQLPVSVFVLPLSNTVPMAAKATRTIPIVSTLIGDPVALGLAQSLARPLANVTGLTVYGKSLTGKRLELLKEAVPAVRRVGLLRNADYPETAQDLREAKVAASALGLELVLLDFTRPQEMLPVLESGMREGIDSLVVVPDAVSATRYAAIARFAATHRLPGVYHHERFIDPAWADPGGLIAYGPDRVYNFRRAAFYVDRLLKGTRPQDLPFEQPTRYLLTVNLRTARMLKLTLSRSLLLRADAVFQ